MPRVAFERIADNRSRSCMRVIALRCGLLRSIHRLACSISKPRRDEAMPARRSAGTSPASRYGLSSRRKPPHQDESLRPTAQLRRGGLRFAFHPWSNSHTEALKKLRCEHSHSLLAKQVPNSGDQGPGQLGASPSATDRTINGLSCRRSPRGLASSAVCFERLASCRS